MVDFASLKKNRSKSLDKLNSQLEKISSKSYSDPNEGKFWKPTRDTAGNGFAIIRFLPAAADEEMPFVRIWDHGFQGPTGLWYIENSLTTINQDDPVSEFNSKLWNEIGTDAAKEQVRNQKRRLKYVSNIYVVKDAANPENEGKVFLYAYGKKIFDKLNDLMNPEFPDEQPVNPFDLWEGANFRLKIRKYEGYPNYDKSEFEAAGPLFDDDEKLEEVWKQEHSLQELLDPKHFKPYAELKAKLYRVLALAEATPAGAANMTAEADDDEIDLSNFSKKSAPAPTLKEAIPESKTSMSMDDDDDDLSIFKELANG